ncbi:MAG: hypothetical protein K2L24_01195 [Opitutales bacterium]|nr:hypothetical protein [Opitutales bacterium]
MDDSQKEFLELLVYLFLRYNKFDEAFAIARVLARYFPRDPFVEMSLAFAALQSDTPSVAMEAVTRAEGKATSKEFEKLFWVLKSKTLWALGKDNEARASFTHFLEIQEQDLRLAVACPQLKAKVRS